VLDADAGSDPPVEGAGVAAEDWQAERTMEAAIISPERLVRIFVRFILSPVEKINI
jgi:hypothetical protein